MVFLAQVLGDFEFIFIIYQIMLTWLNKGITFSSLHRLLLVLEESCSDHIISKVVKERSCGFGFIESHICFETLTKFVVPMWWRHRGDVTTNFININILTDWMADMTT